jgi:uncharacterized caspase-like protein
VALVIGNAAYPGAALPNASNDAKDMAAALGGLGFRVVEARDASREQTGAAIVQAQQLLQGRAGVGLLYYAGHGMQLDWRNYLVPVDAQLTSAADVPRQTVDVQRVIDAFRDAPTAVNILVLDACRDNPFGRAAAVQGLAPLDAPPGTYFAYATSPGNVAEDGSAADGNGLYTRFLLKEIVQPGAKIEEVFKRVRMQVRKASQGRQIPWESSSLFDEFVFASGERLARPAVPNFEPDYNREIEQWRRIVSSDQVADFYAFLQQHPAGVFAELCEARIERLQHARIVAQASPQQVTQDPLRQRFRVGDEYDSVDTDGRTGAVMMRMTTRVTQVTDEWVEYTRPNFRGVMSTYRSTPFGAVIQDAQGSYEPPYVATPTGEFRVGHRWRGRTQRRRGGQWDWMDYEGAVTGREALVVAGQTHHTYRIELSLSFGDGLYRRVTRWCDPAWGLSLKSITESLRGGPTGTDREVRVLEATALRRGV